MTSNFPLRYDMSGDDESKWILPDDPMSEDPDNPEKIHFELNSIYYLIVGAVPIEVPVRLIIYIFKPYNTDAPNIGGIKVSTPSHGLFDGKDMRQITSRYEENIYKTIDAYVDAEGTPHQESHFYIQEWDYENGSLKFNITVNHSVPGFTDEVCSGIYITEGASLSYPAWHPFSKEEQQETSWETAKPFELEFAPPPRGFYKNMQIYIRPISAVEIKVHYIKSDGLEFKNNVPQLFDLDGHEYILSEDE